MNKNPPSINNLKPDSDIKKFLNIKSLNSLIHLLIDCETINDLKQKNNNFW